MINYEIPEEDLPELFAFVTVTKNGAAPNYRLGVRCQSCDAIVSGESSDMFEDRHWAIAEFHNQLHNLELREPHRLPKGNNK
jgi:hypothetical protein